MKLILYTKTGCPWCDAVRSFLNEKKISFEEREVLGNKTFFDEMIVKSGQSKAPTLDVDGAILADTDMEAVEKFLTKRGILK